MRLTATCVFGIESILANEIKKLGYKIIETENGRVTYEGDIQSIIKSNIWIRTGERIYIELKRFNAYTFDDLFEGVKSINWKRFIPENGNFPVNVTSINSKLYSIPDCQSIVKKAVVDKLSQQYNINWFDEDGEKYGIEVFIHKNKARVYLDTTGIGLHKRGYRTLNTVAPLRETIASALIQISYWNRDRHFLDPFCGSGTIPIEAAMIAKNIAPGRNRRFDSSNWTFIDEKEWLDGYDEAYDTELDYHTDYIKGSDIDKKNIELCLYHAQQAEVNNIVSFRTCDVADIKKENEYGVIVCNPPYGERLLNKEEVNELYKKMSIAFKQFDTWAKYIITDVYNFESIYGKKANKRRKVYNGMINCTYYQYFGPKPIY